MSEFMNPTPENEMRTVNFNGITYGSQMHDGVMVHPELIEDEVHYFDAAGNHYDEMVAVVEQTQAINLPPHGEITSIKIEASGNGDIMQSLLRALKGGATLQTYTPAPMQYSQPVQQAPVIPQSQFEMEVAAIRAVQEMFPHLFTQGDTSGEYKTIPMENINVVPTEPTSVQHVEQPKPAKKAARAPKTAERAPRVRSNKLWVLGGAALAATVFIAPVVHAKDTGMDAAKAHNINPVARYMDAIKADIDHLTHPFSAGDKK